VLLDAIPLSDIATLTDEAILNRWNKAEGRCEECGDELDANGDCPSCDEENKDKKSRYNYLTIHLRSATIESWKLTA
jgi:ssDNA-binding Zn-finger/Zn-ribbon topoisomerase 1